MKLSLDDSIDRLPGVGLIKKKALNDHGIFTIYDLIQYFPRRYLDRNLTDNVLLQVGNYITTIVEIVDSYVVHHKRSRLIVTSKTHKNEKIDLVFFKGIPYFKKLFSPNTVLIISGKLEYFRGFQIIHPEFEHYSEDKKDDYIHSSRIIPLYPSNEDLKKEGFDSKGLRRIIHYSLKNLDGNKLEILPLEIVKKRKLIPREPAFEQIHFPKDEDSLNLAKKRFQYEEIFHFQLILEFQRSEKMKTTRTLWPLPKSKSSEKILKDLKFQLTKDQILCLDRLKKLGSLENPFTVLLQGDVGSGKTLTALLTALHYVDNSIQVCFLAPTEILATQHYKTISNFLGNQPFLEIDLFLGGEGKSIKKEKLQRLKTGESLIIIGTHSLLGEDVEFENLGFIIIDEQHKFGVNQREALIKKGKNPDILAMTATPIPRSLCLTIFGGMELLTIKTKPIGRKDIITKWFWEDRRAGVYNSIRKYVNQGRQVYIVYPLVEESEKVDLKSCLEEYEKLKNEIFRDLSVGLLHGKMKSNEKDLIMRKFLENEIQILVTTTVIEVGVDVPNATVIVIEHADRFGISQLHQLRGRVGRSDLESFCILMTHSNVTEEAKIRMKALERTNDGFELSEIDLELRGPGEFFGFKQSGIPGFQFTNIQQDVQKFELVKDDIKNYVDLKTIDREKFKKLNSVDFSLN